MKSFTSLAIFMLLAPTFASGADYELSAGKISAFTRDGQSTRIFKLKDLSVKIGKSEHVSVRLEGPDLFIINSLANANAVCARFGMGRAISTANVAKDGPSFVQLEADGSAASVLESEWGTILTQVTCEEAPK